VRPGFDDRGELSEAFARHVNRGKVATYAELGLDIVMGERSGSWFHDAFDRSRRWLNCHCNGGVFNLGHRNPAVVAAVREGLDHLDVGNHHLVSGWRAELARRLAASTGGRLPGVVFGVSGGESVDLALKLARAHTGRQGIVSAAGGYHGHTGLAMAAGDQQYRDPFGANPPEFSQVPFGDLDAMAAAPQHVMVAAYAGLGAYDAQAAGRVTVPALYIAADEPAPRCDMGRLHELLPQLQLGQTVGSGHFCQLEVPEQVHPMIDRFLAISGLT